MSSYASKMRLPLLMLAAVVVSITTCDLAHAVEQKTLPLKKRVANAEVVFVGKLIEKQMIGDWVYAKLLVQEPLLGVKKEQKVAVTWRAKIRQFNIYDLDEGSVGVAVLDSKRERRFWLRADKFEDLRKLKEIKQLVAEIERDRPPKEVEDQPEEEGPEEERPKEIVIPPDPSSPSR